MFCSFLHLSSHCLRAMRTTIYRWQSVEEYFIEPLTQTIPLKSRIQVWVCSILGSGKVSCSASSAWCKLPDP